MFKKVRSHHDFMFGYLHALVISLARPAMVFLIFFMATITLISAGLIYQFEHLANDSINSYFDALYYTVTIITGVGLGDIAPLTFYGRLISMVTMIAGTSVFVCATAIIATSILQIENSKDA